MPEAKAPSAPSQPIGAVARISAGIDRIRSVVIVLGLLALGAAFGLAAWAIQKDYLLRVAGLWNSVTGSPRGASAHASNKAMAELAVEGAKWATGVVGLALVIPRREEGAFFRWTGWLSFLLAAVLCAVAFLGLLGYLLSDPSLLFAPTPKALPPNEWRQDYLVRLAVGAMLIAALFAACLGVRWVFWGIARLVRAVQSNPSRL